MSKPTTVHDLNEALKPLMLAIKQMKEEQTVNNSQINEIHQQSVATAIKLELFEQQLSSIQSNINGTPAAPKKLVGRKGSTKKPVVKKEVKGKGKKGDDEPTDDEPEEQADDADDVDADAVDTADVVGAANTVDADDDTETVEAASTAEIDSDEEESKTTKKKVVKKPVVKVPTKKAAKAAPVKKAAPKIKKLNKMVFFKKVFEENENAFDEHLTAKIKKPIDTENKEKWSKLTGAALAKAKAIAYYPAIKDSKWLDDMRDAYMLEHADDNETDDNNIDE